MPSDANDPPPPVGEDNWVAYIDEARRTADDLEKRVRVIELYKQAVSAEPGSVKIWLAYCEFFHSLHVASQAATPPPSWTAEDAAIGRDIFSLDQDLSLWQTAYEDIRLRIGDSHLLWDRWIEVEMEQLVRTQTREGMERITLLYRDRLRTPHLTWDETSQRFSSFLSEYSKDSWEAVMREVTEHAQEAKAIVDARQRFEFPLQKAARDGNLDEERSVMKEYLAWEIAQSRWKGDSPSAVPRCLSLFARALAGIFNTDGTVWLDYIAYLSASLSETQTASSLLSPLQRAVSHCPWSGPLWSRYILAAEEAGLSFGDIEQIKHSATNNSEIYRDGLASLLDMYVAWCGYLKRFAVDPNASEEAVDVADVGLPAAIESVEVLGNRLYGTEYQGDPDFRLERIYMQFLTEKKGNIDKARLQWEHLARKPLYADKYDFWRAYFLWEMQVFGMRRHAPVGSVVARTPEKATAVLARAVNRKALDWPERAIAVYLQHCNKYELPRTIRQARDNVHKVRIAVAKRREREAREAAEAYAYQAQAAAGPVADAGPAEASTAADQSDNAAPESPSGGTKRKRTDTLGGADDETTSKRPKGAAEANGDDAPAVAAKSKEKTGEDEGPKRDREHTSVLITNLAGDVTQTAIKKYLKEFGRIQNISLVRDGPQASTALVEFEAIEDAEDCVKFRDNKYLGDRQIRVESGAGLTLFVTNYPPAANDAYMRELFGPCGEVLSIRWPSLKFNTRRRFCYVSFRTRDAAAKAARMSGRVLEGKFRLEAKPSDPSRRKRRDDAVSERREVYVGNLDPTLREADVRDVFGKYGPVARVSMVAARSADRQGSESAFVEYERSEGAAAAVAELHNTKLRSRVLVVELAQARAQVSAKVVNAGSPSASAAGAEAAGGEDVPMTTVGAAGEGGAPSVAAASEEAAPGSQPAATTATAGPARDHGRKVAVMNLPDTVNEARVMELAREVGPVEKLVLQPRRGSAVVTFVDEAAAGRAMMGLEGREWEGRRLRTGNMEALARYMKKGEEEEEVAKEKGRGGNKEKEKEKGKGKGLAGLAPVNVRRPVLGGRGGRRGVGPVVARPKATGAGEAGDSGGKAEGGKSNADFKAMFLGGGESGGS